MAYVIGCDVGTQSLKGVLMNGDGKIVAEASSAYDASFPHPNWAEQDTNLWRNALRHVISSLLEQSQVDADEIGTLGFSSQLDGVVPVDKNGVALRSAIIWLDRRAESQCRRLQEKISAQDIFSLTGLNLDSSHVAPKILWIRDEQPNLFNDSSTLLLPGSFMVHQLTGERVVDYSNASSTMLYDVKTKTWSPEMLRASDLDERLLGRIAPAEEVAGTLTAAAAKELGLKPTTKVVVGCGDDHGACLGAGLVRPGLVCDSVGTAEPVAATADKPLFDETKLVETHAHAHSDLWLIQNPGFVSGGSIRWYSDVVAKMNYSEMTVPAEKVPAGSEGLIFLPCLSGAMTPTWNGNARGVFYGLSMHHRQEHMTRAVLEGCAFGFRDISQRFTALGMDCKEVRIVGGGAKSALWCQIKADATGLALRTLKNMEASATGAAMLAGVAEGIFSSLVDAADRVVEFGETYEPNPLLKSQYDEAYHLYRNVYAALEPVFNQSNSLQGVTA